LVYLASTLFQYNIIFLYLLYYNKSFKNPSFKQKSPSANAKGLGISNLPLLERFGTFKEDIAIENIRLVS